MEDCISVYIVILHGVPHKGKTINIADTYNNNILDLQDKHKHVMHNMVQSSQANSTLYADKA